MSQLILDYQLDVLVVVPPFSFGNSSKSARYTITQTFPIQREAKKAPTAAPRIGPNTIQIL